MFDINVVSAVGYRARWFIGLYTRLELREIEFWFLPLSLQDESTANSRNVVYIKYRQLQAIDNVLQISEKSFISLEFCADILI
jgi:hypothetical protein